MLKTIKILIAQGLSAYHIAQVLKDNGKRVYCFGSYYTVGKNAANRVCFFETDDGVKAEYVNTPQEA